MQRYKCTIEYDGTGLVGWQKQDKGQSVQGFLEKAIHQFCQEEVTPIAAGRTDAGVHARGQVIHFDLKADRSPYHIQQGINYHLLRNHAPVAILDIEKTDQEFSARFSAKKRVYEYHIIHRTSHLILDHNRAWHIYGDFDVKAMQEAATHLLGKHDFTSFRATECQASSPVKTLDSIEFSHQGNRSIVTIEATSFLHRMVRNMVGTLSLVGQGKWQPDDVKTALEACDRTKAGPAAPACGLYFMEVKY